MRLTRPSELSLGVNIALQFRPPSKELRSVNSPRGLTVLPLLSCEVREISDASSPTILSTKSILMTVDSPMDKLVSKIENDGFGGVSSKTYFTLFDSAILPPIVMPPTVA